MSNTHLTDSDTSETRERTESGSHELMPDSEDGVPSPSDDEEPVPMAEERRAAMSLDMKLMNPSPGRGQRFHITQHQAPHLQALDDDSFGDSRTVGERHISYLLRQWELYSVCDANDPHPIVRYRHEPIQLPVCRSANRGSLVLGLAAIGGFSVCWLTLALSSALSRLDATICALVFAHFCQYLTITATSGFGMYRCWSFADGFNIIPRFSLKQGVKPRNGEPPDRLTFKASRMPCSISSTVSSRGSTLNKVMIGSCYSLGVGLFIKFSQMSLGWLTLVAIGYLCIILPALFENRTFNLDSARALVRAVDPQGHPVQAQLLQPIIHHREPILGNGEPPVDGTFIEGWSSTYDWYHASGVGLFLFMTFIGFSANLWYNLHGKGSNNQVVSWKLSLAAVIVGLFFICLNSLLTYVPQAPMWHPPLVYPVAPVAPQPPFLFRWFVATKRSKRGNILWGTGCILIELCALLLATAAGIVYSDGPVMLS